MWYSIHRMYNTNMIGNSMKENWLKKIFRRRKKTSSTDVAKINNSLTYIPKMNELDKKSKQIISDYYNKLNVYNYESLVKFSYDLVKKVDVERDVLINTMTRYREITRFYRERKFQRDEPLYSKAYEYHYAMLSKEEYKVIVDEIVNTRKEVTLRYKALEMFIEKEKRDAKNLFNRDKRLIAKRELNGLINEQERLLTFITCIDQVCAAVFNTINTNIILNAKQDDLFEAESNLDRDRAKVYTSVGIAFSRTMEDLRFRFPSELKEWYLNELYNLLTKELTGKVLPSKFEFYDGYSFNNEQIEKNMVEAFIHGTDRWDWLVYTAPKDLLDKVYNLLAKAHHKREVYLREHYHDYDKFMKEMDDLINMYEAMPIDDWDKDYLGERLDYFALNIREYIIIFYECQFDHENKISEDIIHELKKKLYKVGFLNEAVNGRESSVDKILSPTKIHKWHGYNFYYPTQLFYNSADYFYELLTKVEKKYYATFPLNYKYPKIEIEMYKKKVRDEYYFKSKSIKGIVHDLYYLLEGKTDFITIAYKASKKEDLYKYICSTDSAADYSRTQCLAPGYGYIHYRAPFNKENDHTFTYDLDKVNNFVSLEEMFYLTKYISPGAFELYYPLPISENFYQIYPDHQIESNTEFVNFLARVKIRVLKNKYDNRINVVPRSIIFDEDNISKIKKIQDLGHENAIALYVSTYNQFEFLYKLCRKRKKEEYNTFMFFGPFYEYILVDEDVYKKLNGVDYSTDTFKVIPVPKVNHYYELSKYLDMELNKEEINNKSK